MTDYQLEDAIASATGGRAYYSTNDLVEALSKATEAGSVYYTITYDPENHTYDGGLRQIEVKLAKKGYQLSYRPSYYAVPDTTPDETAESDSAPRSGKAGTPPPDSLYIWVRHGMPMNHDVIFLVALHRVGASRLATGGEMTDLADYPAYFRTRNKHRPTAPLAPLPPLSLQRYEIDYSVPTRQFREMSGMKHAEQDTLEFVAAAYDREGLLLNGAIDHATSTRKDATNTYQAIQIFDVPASAASISLAVRDADTGLIGNLEISLEKRALPATDHKINPRETQ
jgi:hypothetical protein